MYPEEKPSCESDQPQNTVADSELPVSDENQVPTGVQVVEECAGDNELPKEETVPVHVVRELENRLMETEARLRAVSGAYRNLQDEMRSYQERVQRTEEERDKRRKGEIVATLFEPVQNLRRSIEAMGNSEAAASFVQGLELVFEQFNAALHKLGLEEVPGIGSLFDPNIHEAMGTVLVTEAEQDGRVMHVYDTGYRIGSVTIRPARVIIGRYQKPVEE